MPSLRNHIDQHCKSCSYDKEDVGGWRQQVAECRGFTCRLYPVRPLPINTKPEDFPITTEDINRLGTNIYVRTLED
jgi:hypothetical protein